MNAINEKALRITAVVKNARGVGENERSDSERENYSSKFSLYNLAVWNEIRDMRSFSVITQVWMLPLQVL
jgi:hypothetical protein